MRDPQPATSSKANRSLTLERGLRVLRVLAAFPDGLTISELAAKMDTHRAGIYRLVGPLVDQRFVQRAPDGRLTLGLGLLEIASYVRPVLQEIAVPVLRQLSDELGATTALTIRDRDEAVVAAVVEPRGALMHLAYKAGLRHSLDVAAPGLAILAGSRPLDGERPEVAEARRIGYALSSGELLPGTTGVAAPIVVRGGEAEASISAVWIEPRDGAVAGSAVRRAAQEIASHLS